MKILNLKGSGDFNVRLVNSKKNIFGQCILGGFGGAHESTCRASMFRKYFH